MTGRSLTWPNDLAAVINAAAETGWGWDGRTCLHLMIEAAAAVSGRDVRGAVHDLIGGAMPATRNGLLRTLAKLGGLEAAVAATAARLGFPEIDPGVASGGDWGVADFAGDPAQTLRAEGVLKIEGGWVFRLPSPGVTVLPTEFAPVRRAWAVG